MTTVVSNKNVAVMSGAYGGAEGSTRVRRKALLALLVLLALLLASFIVPSFARASTPQCPNEDVRAESSINPATGKPYSTELPNCAAYELVSSEKNDADAISARLIQSSALPAADGAQLVWSAPSVAQYGQPSNGASNVYRAVRAPASCTVFTCWPMSTLTTRSLEVEGGALDGHEQFMLAAATPDLSTVLIYGERLTEGEHVGGAGRVLELAPDGIYTAIATTSAASTAQPVAEVSADGSHVFLQTYAHLLHDDSHHAESRQVYEWTKARGLSLAGVNSETEQISACGASLVRGGVSVAGSRVFFQSPDPQDNSAPEECKLGPVVNASKLFVSDLYVREDGATTIDISKPPPGVSDYGAQFVGATLDGSKVFFVSESALTPDKVHSGPGYADLYELDMQTRVIRRLSGGAEEAGLTPLGQSSSGVAIVSADGSHAYFTALGRLVPGAGRTRLENEAACGGAGPHSSSCTANLYLFADGRISFIANVQPGTDGGLHAVASEALIRSPLLDEVAAITSDGSVLVFNSQSRLTSYDNEGHGELYRYDAASATISCVSCNPSGAPAEGVVYMHDTPPARAGAERAEGMSFERLGGLSSDGATVFFASTDRLLPAAVNADPAKQYSEGKVGFPLIDVYEWHDGVLSLISTGVSESDDYLLGASPDGTNVFFATTSALVPRDGDHAYDIYDARVGGGFPSARPPAACSATETCRSMLATPPAPVAPASIALSRPGNLPPVGESRLLGAGVKPNPSTQARQLSKALKACRRKPKKKRVSCRAHARRTYGQLSGAKRSSTRVGPR
ncbi:MAG: hypothetical protein QOI89_1116 [Solirubrobacteraceae bacterium]|jgi:hypothetical protein|nr:hypothetical protein [Solirubrobacteraceae bacterium]